MQMPINRHTGRLTRRGRRMTIPMLIFLVLATVAAEQIAAWMVGR
jgi:hypothetical protein